ncbi:hypothetical protein ML462_09370 [Gramella lutea]|uniref:Uncharacterized protein n=1 Tax=Christiangramia lutea TaxID=1607951 RepID=A0A9X1V3B0_9FLAO|nr:hypothetical protein [Christiangramia lutea]MCH4823383.1 hypothetical protein [Christiangramia lutea]
MKTNRLLIVFLIVGAILLIPFLAMQFDTGVNWSAFDFIVMGILLLITGIAIERALSMVSSARNRLIICGIILMAFLLVWAELAVGVFGTPFAGS